MQGSLPRRGTPAFDALERVHSLGGKASIHQLLAAVNSNFRSPTRLDKLAIQPLALLGFVTRLKTGIQITPAGQVFIESNAAKSSIGAKVLPSQPAPPTKPLHSASAFDVIEARRPGALDYRNIPSLMGGVRVPYRSSCQVTGQSGGGDGND
ncbi:hypothetical protein EDC30_104273 [Paucimonas lemoignei]|uniref:Uncharacterized protein n=1 Tax=Paucimonas lemoignei TaxID=29443 RepID=A0A4R3I0W4_PAULE|nr:hypothetical protein [Paucimonas lemoignei]TCS37469.1 hypothetical protein EDC30_104273 [Paucimonas lemoignei]